MRWETLCTEHDATWDTRHISFQKQIDLEKLCIFISSSSSNKCILTVWVCGHSPCACPLGKTVRLGLVRRHCYVSKLPWKCCHSPISLSFSSSCLLGGQSHDWIDPHNTGIQKAVSLSFHSLFNSSSRIDHLSYSCHLQLHFPKSFRHWAGLFSAVHQNSEVCADVSQQH